MDRPKVLIQSASLSDEKQILNLERAVWKETLNLRDVADKYDLATFIRFGYVFVAKSKGKVVGAIIAIRTKRNHIFVADWVVKKGFRRQGIGKKLYQRLLNCERGYKFISLVSSRYKASVAAHKKMGFKEKKIIKDAYGVGEKEYYHLIFKEN